MIEKDPNGLNQHEPGAKLDYGKIKPALVMAGFARALTEVSEVATYGAEKYSPNGWAHVPDGVERYTNAMYRHLLQEETEGAIDSETGLYHAAQAAWNALARLELMLRELEK